MLSVIKSDGEKLPKLENKLLKIRKSSETWKSDSHVRLQCVMSAIWRVSVLRQKTSCEINGFEGENRGEAYGK